MTLLLREPSIWNARLRTAEFAFTRRHVYIVEGASVQALPLDESLDITLEEPAGRVGNIYLRQNDKMRAVIHTAFRRVKVHYDSSALDTSAPFQGFLQIEHAAEVCRMLDFQVYHPTSAFASGDARRFEQRDAAVITCCSVPRPGLPV